MSVSECENCGQREGVHVDFVNNESTCGLHVICAGCMDYHGTCPACEVEA